MTPVCSCGRDADTTTPMGADICTVCFDWCFGGGAHPDDVIDAQEVAL